MSAEVFLYALAVILVAGAVQSITGFGFGIVAVPLMAALISPKLVAPITVFESLLLNTIILSKSHSDVALGRIWPLVVAGIVGVPIGVWMLVNWEVHVLRIYVGVATVAFTLLFLKGFSRPATRERLVFVPVGLVSGVMSGSINMAGPPVILFLTNQQLPRAVFRASIVAYFYAVVWAAVPFMVAAGLLDVRALLYSVALSPALVAGAMVGSKLAPHIDEVAVRRITLFIVLGAGVTSIISGVLGA